MTVESIMEKIFGDTELGQSLLLRGIQEGRREVLDAFLRERFGDHPDIPAIAQGLAKWPDATAIAQAVCTTATLGELLPPRPAT
jgi:hypothetical protein